MYKPSKTCSCVLCSHANLKVFTLLVSVYILPYVHKLTIMYYACANTLSHKYYVHKHKKNIHNNVGMDKLIS